MPHVGRRESTCGSQAAGPGRYSPGPTAAPPIVVMMCEGQGHDLLGV